MLAEMMKNGSITGMWQTTPDLSGPKEIKESELVDRNVPAGIIAEEVKDG